MQMKQQNTCVVWQNSTTYVPEIVSIIACRQM